MTIAMKSLTILCLGLGTLLTLDSCYVYTPPKPRPLQPRGSSIDEPPTRYFGAEPPEGPQPPVDPSQVQPPLPRDPNAPPPEANTPPVTTPPPVDVTPKPPSSGKPELPYGIKVPNKPGFVYSPYDKTAGIVDVTGFAPGTKVKCPYTNKVFLVP